MESITIGENYDLLGKLRFRLDRICRDRMENGKYISLLDLGKIHKITGELYRIWWDLDKSEQIPRGRRYELNKSVQIPGCKKESRNRHA